MLLVLGLTALARAPREATTLLAAHEDPFDDPLFDVPQEGLGWNLTAALQAKDSDVAMDSAVTNVSGSEHIALMPAQAVRGMHGVSAWKSIVYIKIPKTGSSTLAGVLRRIAVRHKLNGAEKCTSSWAKEPLLWAEHSSYRILASKIERLTKPYLLTLMRDPVDRCFSHYYYTGSKEDKMKYMKRRCLGYQTHFMAENTLRQGGNETDAQNILQMYDLIGVASRFDESVVMMAHQLGVGNEDIAYIASKVADGKGHIGVTNTHPPFGQEPRRVRRYSQSAEWKEGNRFELELFRAANAKLDEFYTSGAARKRLAQFVGLRKQLEHDMYNASLGELDVDMAASEHLILACED